jgi:hypothetical protein
MIIQLIEARINDKERMIELEIRVLANILNAQEMIKQHT